MTKRKFLNLLLCAVMLFCFASCVNTKTEPTDKTTNGRLDDIFSDYKEEAEKPVIDLSEIPPMAECCYWADDEQAIEKYESGLMDDEADASELLTDIHYIGEKITKSFFIKNSADVPTQYGVFVEINGIRQNINVELDGKKYSETRLFEFTVPAEKSMTLNVSFIPNTGKNGEKLIASFNSMFCSAFIATDKTALQDYWGSVQEVDSYTANIYMDKEPSNSVKICTDYSDIKIGDVDKRVYKLHSENTDNRYYKYVGSLIYKDIDDCLAEEGCILSAMKTEKSTEDKLKILLFGKSGKYRVSFFINNELMNVFDGCDYAEVEFGEMEQAEITMTIDNSVLDKYNHCYVVIIPVDEELTIDDGHYDYRKSITYKYTVER